MLEILYGGIILLIKKIDYYIYLCFDIVSKINLKVLTLL